MDRREYHVYIMANAARTLYIGVTNDVYSRVAQHKRGEIPGFTSTYHLNRLVYVESTTDVGDAIAREKQLKGWLRRRKIELIESLNPDWQDLSAEWTTDPSLRSG